MSLAATTPAELQTRIEQLERELTDTRSQLQQVFDHIPLGAAMMDSEMRYLRVNRIWIEDFRLTESELIGKSHYEVFPEISEERREIHRRCLQGEVNVTNAYPFPRADGRTDWVHGTVRPWYQPDGQVGGLLMYTSVITPRMEAEEKLRNSEARYRSLVENNPDFIMIVDQNQDIQFVNWLSSGMTPEQVIGKNALDFLPPEAVETARAIHLAVLNGAAPTRYETVGPGPLEGLNWYETRVQPIYTNNEITGLTLIATNITERKRIRDALHESESNAQSLLRLYRSLESATTNREIIKAVTEEINKRTGYRTAWFYLFPEEGDYAELISGEGELFEDDSKQIATKLIRLKISGDPFMEEIALATHIVVVEDALTDPRTDKKIVELTGNRTIINIPILLPDKRLGVLGTGSFGDEGVRLLTQSQLDYLAAVASHLAVALDRIRFLEERRQSEEALRQSEANYREAQRIAQLGNFEFNIKTRGLTWSEELSHFFNIEPGTPITMELYESLIPPSEFTRVMTSVSMAIETGETYEIEHEVILRDGTHKYLFAIGRPYKDDDGNVAGIFGIAQDITARKQVEEALRRSEANLKEAQRIAKIGNFEFNPQSRELAWSDETYNIFEIEPGTPITMEFYQSLIKPESFKEVEARISQAIATRQSYEIEYEINLPNGKEKCVYLISRPILNEQGEVERIFGIVQDVTARKQAEEALRQSEERYRIIVEAIPDLIFRLNRDGVYIDAKDSPQLLAPLEAFIGKKIQELLPAPQGQEALANIRQAIETGEIVLIENQTMTPVGMMIYESRIVPVANNEVLLLVRDVTDRKQAEEALRRSENRYRTLVDNLPGILIGLMDPDLRFTFAGGDEIRNLGFARDEVIGKYLHEMRDPENSLREIQGALQGRVVQYENHWNNNDYMVNYIPIFDAQGQLESIMSLSQNITERKRAQRALQEQHDFLQTVIDLVPGAVVVKDAAGRFLLTNQGMADIFGVSKAELQGKTDMDFGMSREQFEEYLIGEDEVRTTGQPLLRPEEEVHGRYLQVTIIPLKNAEGINDRVLVVAFDITWRRAAEVEREKLIDELTVFHTLVEAATSGIVMANPRGIITYANPAFHEMHGYNYQLKEAVGLPVGNFQSTTTRAAFYGHSLQELLQGAMLQGETQDQHKSGEIFDATFSTFPIRNGQGDIIKIGAIIDDISIRKRAETERENMLNRTHRLYRISQKLARVQNEMELIEVLHEEIPGQDNVTIILNYTQFDSEGQPVTLQVIAVKVYGEPFMPPMHGASISVEDFGISQLLIQNPYETYLISDTANDPLLDEPSRKVFHDLGIPSVALIPMYQNGRWMGVVGINWREHREFSEEDLAIYWALPPLIAPVSENLRLIKRLEQNIEELKIATNIAQESSRLKSEFLATMSHELRTPLNAIEGFTSIMLGNMGVELNPHARKMVERVGINSKRLLNLINDFLDLSRIEAGRMELISAPLSPRMLAQQWRDQMSGAAEAKKLPIVLDLDPTLPATIMGDEEALTKVVLNLLSNAVKFTHQGQITVTVRYHIITWSIEVKDTGIGIPFHAREYIFDEFRQVDQSSKRLYGGTGLGLAIVQKLTRAMGGNVSLKSEPGVGSAFTVILPTQPMYN